MLLKMCKLSLEPINPTTQKDNIELTTNNMLEFLDDMRNTEKKISH